MLDICHFDYIACFSVLYTHIHTYTHSQSQLAHTHTHTHTHTRTHTHTLQWFGLKFPVMAVYFDVVREFYEAYVLYNFLCYLLNFLKSNYDLPAELETQPPVRPSVPFCCCPAWPTGARFVCRCKIGVLQYSVVRVVLTLIAL